jgi:hypothetical protein
MLRNYAWPARDTFKNVASTPMKPQTFGTVRVRATKPFFALRRLIEAGEVVSLAEPDARDAIALRRAEKI